MRDMTIDLEELIKERTLAQKNDLARFLRWSDLAVLDRLLDMLRYANEAALLLVDFFGGGWWCCVCACVVLVGVTEC